MKKLFVYADFDWLETPQLIGKLSCDSVRGSETYSFSYDKEWLAKYGDVFLSEDLQNYTGIQYTRRERDIFACFSDALPAVWESTLLNRREQAAVSDEKRAVRRLTSFDYLIGIDDASRMGFPVCRNSSWKVYLLRGKPSCAATHYYQSKPSHLSRW